MTPVCQFAEPHLNWFLCFVGLLVVYHVFYTKLAIFLLIGICSGGIFTSLASPPYKYDKCTRTYSI